MLHVNRKLIAVCLRVFFFPTNVSTHMSPPQHGIGGVAKMREVWQGVGEYICREKVRAEA